jgi:N-glycosylase/DNA lyase
VDATLKALDGGLPLERDSALSLSTEELRQKLLSVNGIGEKVAHCILLLGYGRYDSFPVDVWVRRVMENLYFGGLDGTKAGAKTSPSKILNYAKDRFGDYAGFANQYLFHYMRLNSGILE